MLCIMCIYQIKKDVIPDPNKELHDGIDVHVHEKREVPDDEEDLKDKDDDDDSIKPKLPRDLFIVTDPPEKDSLFDSVPNTPPPPPCPPPDPISTVHYHESGYQDEKNVVMDTSLVTLHSDPVLGTIDTSFDYSDTSLHGNTTDQSTDDFHLSPAPLLPTSPPGEAPPPLPPPSSPGEAPPPLPPTSPPRETPPPLPPTETPPPLPPTSPPRLSDIEMVNNI